MTQIIFLTMLLSVWQNPTPVYVGPGDQTIDVVISDGEGGAAVIWWDDLTDWNYMQVIDSEGNLKWDAEGVPIIATVGLFTQNPDVFQDGEGNYWVALEGNEDIYVQKLSPTGQRLFGDDGVAVCAAEGEQSNSHICYSGNATIIVWKDARETTPIYLYTQRVSQDGNILWEVNGVKITETDYGTLAKCVPDVYGGAFYIFRRWIESENYISGQHIDSLGSRMWGDSGTLFVKGSMHPQFGSIQGHMVKDDSGGFVFFYDEGGYYRANRVDSVGNLLWDTSSVILGENHYNHYGSVSSMSSSGFYIVRGTDIARSFERVYAHRLTLEGLTPWDISGKLVWDVWAYNPRERIVPRVSKDGLMIWRDAWDEGHPQEGQYDERGILANRIDTSGNILWTEEVLVCGISGDNPEIVPTSDKAGIVIWNDTRNGNVDLYSTRIDSLGNLPPCIEEEPYPSKQFFEVVTTVGTRIVLRFADANSSHNVGIFDASGRLVDEVLLDGPGTISWGKCYGPGVYFIREAGESSPAQKVVLIR